MHPDHSQKIVDSFSRQAHEYDNHTNLQKEVAARLAARLPTQLEGDILEIGCGTGHLTQHLARHFPHARFHITDIAPAMVEICRKKIFNHRESAFTFSIMDGEHLPENRRYDLIVSNMCFQWFSNPLLSLERMADRLNPGGHLLFSTIGPDSFLEWKMAAVHCGLAHGFLESPNWPYIVDQESIAETYENGFSFLRSLKNIGAHRAARTYKQLPASDLKKLMQAYDELYKGHITWQILYGMIRR